MRASLLLPVGGARRPRLDGPGRVSSRQSGLLPGLRWAGGSSVYTPPPLTAAVSHPSPARARRRPGHAPVATPVVVTLKGAADDSCSGAGVTRTAGTRTTLAARPWRNDGALPAPSAESETAVTIVVGLCSVLGARCGPQQLSTMPPGRGAPPAQGGSNGALTWRRRRRGRQMDRHRSLRSRADRVFTRKRVFLIKNSVTILRTGLHVAVNGDFAHNNLRSGTAFRPVCQLYTIRSVSQS